MFESFNALMNEPMSAHTTLKLGGPADYMVFPRNGEEIAAMFREAAEKTTLPDNPDMEKVGAFVERINRHAVLEDY